MSTSKGRGKAQGSRAKPASYSQMYKSAAAGVGSATPLVTRPAESPASGRPSEAPVRSKTSDDVNWRQEYGYVVGDLTRLGLVTAGLVIAIIIAGLFI